MMKTKLTLFVTTIAAALFFGGCASTEQSGSTESKKSFSRHMLLKKADGKLVNVQFAGMKMKVMGSTDSSLKTLLGKSFEVRFVNNRFVVTAEAGEVSWSSRWSFWPGGEARVGDTPQNGLLAVPVQDDTLEWPIAEGDEAGYQSRRNLLMHYEDPEHGKHQLHFETVSHKIALVKTTFEDFKVITLGETPGPKGHHKMRPAGNAHNKPLDLSLGSSVWWVSFQNGQVGWTTDWTFYPDGSARAYERPRSDGTHEVIPQ
jgi:hypothetical protein